MNKQNSTKKKFIIGTVTLALAILTVGSFAFFTDYSTSSVIAKGGTVNVSVSDINLTNAGNINPGDNDMSSEKTYIPEPGDPLYNENATGASVNISTTDHDLSFDITNNGSKSVRTRQTIVIKATKDDSIIDPSVFSILDSTTSKELGSSSLFGTKTYILKDGTEVSNIGENLNVVAIKYQRTLDVFDGTGENAEIESMSSVKANDNNVVTKNYAYKLAMAKNSKNNYQNANVNIDVVIEGMQYRNTTQDDWTTLSSTNITGTTTDTSINVVPKAQ